MVEQAKAVKTSSGESETLIQSSLEKLTAALRAVDALYGQQRVQDDFLQRTFERRRQLLLDLANMPRGDDGFKWFSKKWRKWIGAESAESTNSLRTDLRYIWIRESVTFSQQLVDNWLACCSWDAFESSGRVEECANARPTKGKAAAFVADENIPKLLTGQGKTDLRCFYRHSAVRCSLADRKLIFNRLFDLRILLIQGVFEHLDHLKVCRNNGCAAPFYIARRSDQLVCNAEACKAEMQREYARNWWNENRAKTQDSTNSRTKKGRAGNGTRKAR